MEFSGTFFENKLELQLEHFVNLNGSGNITKEDGTEFMDFEIEGDPYNLNKPADFDMSENNSREADSSKSIESTSSDKAKICIA
ncbi:hypothetical protein BDF21DRAFT_465492 [Thamnidium elegans]|nr:hypothetical protein BDF21DRAFT_465492 [Thamnidium elegans]